MGVPEGDVGLDSPEQVGRGLVDSHEGAVVELPEPEDPEDPDGAGVELIDTPDPNNEGNLGSSGHVNLSSGLGIPPGCDLVLLGLGVVGLILLNSLE